MLTLFFVRISKVLAGLFFQLGFFSKTAAVVLVFITPLFTVIGIMVFFLLADSISAIFLRYKIKTGRVKDEEHKEVSEESNPKKRNRLWWIVDRERFVIIIEKLFAYIMVTLVCFVFDRAVLGIHPGQDNLILQFSMTNLGFMLITAMDFKSFLQNMGKATGHPVFTFAGRLLEKKIRVRLREEQIEQEEDDERTQNAESAEKNEGYIKDRRKDYDVNQGANNE